MTVASDDKTIKVIFPPEVIQGRIGDLAAEIAAAEMRDMLVVAVLKGSFVFAADLIRALHVAGLTPQVDFVSLSSYGAGTASSGHVKILRRTYAGPSSGVLHPLGLAAGFLEQVKLGGLMLAV